LEIQGQCHTHRLSVGQGLHPYLREAKEWMIVAHY
jgi:hypothetical protein